MSDGVCDKCPHAVIDHGEALGCMSCTCVDPGLPAATPEPDPEPEASPEPDRNPEPTPEPEEEDADEDDEPAAE